MARKPNQSYNTQPSLKAPFPYFGGKRAVAGVVWAALGNPKHYIEPFCGSAAVLLLRPDYDPTCVMESVNDADCNIANVWRAIKFKPEETAEWCDWPVNHADLMARKRAIIRNKERLGENLVADENWCDPIIAGYWIWAASCWIGRGITCPMQIPHVSDGGQGVHAMGQIPHVGTGGLGLREPFNTNIYEWFRSLSERLRYVRVVCGDWTRVCGGNWQDKTGTCGIFFDPPYAHDVGRCETIYAVEHPTVSRDVAAWAIERGTKESYRIVIAGYADEHPSLVEAGWRVVPWKANGGYARAGNGGQSGTRGDINRQREALFMSPYCLKSESDAELFAVSK
jgi:hypothetical protein